MARATRRVQETGRRIFSGYSEEYTPLAGYSVLLGAFVARPRATRLVASTFAAVAVSDFLHHGYAAAKKLAE